MEDVVDLQWPAEEGRRRELERDQVPRLLLVDPDADPPVSADRYEDWARANDPKTDIDARRAALRQLVSADDVPHVDENGVLRTDGAWVGLPPVEARLLVVLLRNEGEVVSREVLSDAGWPEGSPGRNALDVRILRLRRRIEPLGLLIRTIRSRGYLLERIRPIQSDA